MRTVEPMAVDKVPNGLESEESNYNTTFTTQRQLLSVTIYQADVPATICFQNS